MAKIVLTKEQINQLIFKNRYPIIEEKKFFSCCFEEVFEDKENPCPLTLPGGDLGEMAVILATGNDFGFEIDFEKAFESLSKLIGGERNFSFHNHLFSSFDCSYWQEVKKEPKAFNLTQREINLLQKKTKHFLVNQKSLKKDSYKTAVLLIKGYWSVYPRYFLETEEGKKEVSVFLYQKTLVDNRRKILAKKLIDEKAVKLYAGCDAEYLYQVMSEEGEIHLFEAITRLAKDLPIFQVNFDEEGGFTVEKR